TIGGNVTVSAASTSSTIISASTGFLDLGSATRTFTVANGAATRDLVVSVNISGSGSVGLTKAGTGQMDLSGNNSYGGVTNVSAGVLNARSDTALGASGPGQGTTVVGGAKLQLEGSNLTIADDLTLGTTSGATLLNLSGTNSLSGAVNMLFTSTLNV